MRKTQPLRLVAALATLTAAAGCATTPPSTESVAVSVYQAPIDGSHAMPAGCREVRRTPAESWTELDRAAPDDPYHRQRTATATAGGNVLLVLERMTNPRRDFDCPAAAKITDCRGSLGAWYDLVFASYACSPPGLAELQAERKP
ncbi:MAG TPA: hypothetical protein VGK26_03295 [Thermoanaerobaculia bacterium]|jgi:hypothetical protein